MCACVGVCEQEKQKPGAGDPQDWWSHNNPRGPALFSQATSLKTIKHNEKLVYPKKFN